MTNIKITCPKCNWEPDGGAYWQCTCLHVWNTFETGGNCPNCNKQWKDTQCPKCKAWSPHIDWYKGLDNFVQEEVEKIQVQV